MKVLVGVIARNERDEIGIVIRHSQLTGLYTGITLDGLYWESMLPHYVAHSVNEYWNLYQDQK